MHSLAAIVRTATCRVRRPLGYGLNSGDDAGAAVVEFVLMTLLLVLLLFSVLQLAVFMYARNIVAASAAAGARYGASAGADTDAASAKAVSLIESGLPGAAARRISCSATETTDVGSGVHVIQVTCDGPLRMVLLPFAIPAHLHSSAAAVKEGTP